MPHKKVMPCNGGINNRGVTLTQLQALYTVGTPFFTANWETPNYGGAQCCTNKWDLMYT